jgi:hypothetical protein
MTEAQKLITLQVLLEDGGDVPEVNKLNTYLSVAASEILAWMYHLVGGVPSGVTQIPAKYDNVQVYAVVAGYTQAGAEGEQTHIENGVHRHFRYSDMLDYIHNNVLPIVRVGAIS